MNDATNDTDLSGFLAAEASAAWVEGDVPAEHRRAAEEIRAHLVAVRGGAPFLSPADASTLIEWLDAGVTVASVLLAIERAADARRTKRSRLPLTLGRAKAHLGKAPARAVSKAIASVAAASPRRLGPAIDALLAKGERPLAEELGRISDDLPADELVRRALFAVRAFLQRRWECLSEADRDARIAAAVEELGALVLGENDRARLAEEIVRDELRAEWPMLDAARLWACAHAGAR